MLRNSKIFREIRFKINILFFFYLDSIQISSKKLLRMKKINILYLILAITLFNYLWHDLHYTNNGFKLYSILRNFANGYGTFRG